MWPEDVTAVSIEHGRLMWDFRTGERRIFWRPFVITRITIGDQAILCEADFEIPRGAHLRFTTSHCGGPVSVPVVLMGIQP